MLRDLQDPTRCLSLQSRHFLLVPLTFKPPEPEDDGQGGALAPCGREKGLKKKECQAGLAEEKSQGR